MTACLSETAEKTNKDGARACPCTAFIFLPFQHAHGTHGSAGKVGNPPLQNRKTVGWLASLTSS